MHLNWKTLLSVLKEYLAVQIKNTIIIIITVALYCRNQLQDDLRENHPFFDTPLFAVGRESQLRKVSQGVVE